MPTLTIAASNRDRLDLSKDITKWFLKSLEAQTNKDFEVLIADGGSKNYDELKEYFESRDCEPLIRIVKEPLGEKFERAKMNNVGVRNARTEYIMTTDVDMFFGPNFVDELLKKVNPGTFVESRTMYWKGRHTAKIYRGELDPFTDLDRCKVGRIKKRTTAGGCQCAHIDQWTKVRGFDESFVGWGSEDFDLLTRMNRSGARVKWMGESRESINLFHQHHPKPNIKEDLACQAVNKKILNKSMSGRRPFRANPNGWGGIYDENGEEK
jgi:predicted glycosyltransferase involved in capsule biosynthesis